MRRDRPRSLREKTYANAVCCGRRRNRSGSLDPDCASAVGSSRCTAGTVPALEPMSARCCLKRNDGKSHVERSACPVQRCYLSPGRCRPRHFCAAERRGQNAGDSAARNPRRRSEHPAKMTSLPSDYVERQPRHHKTKRRVTNSFFLFADVGKLSIVH